MSVVDRDEWFGIMSAFNKNKENKIVSREFELDDIKRVEEKFIDPFIAAYVKITDEDNEQKKQIDENVDTNISQQNKSTTDIEESQVSVEMLVY